MQTDRQTDRETDKYHKKNEAFMLVKYIWRHV